MTYIKKILRAHSESVLIFFAVVFLVVIVAFFFEAINVAVTETERAAGFSAVNTSAQFNLQDAAKIDFRGLLKNDSSTAPSPSNVTPSASTVIVLPPPAAASGTATTTQ